MREGEDEGENPVEILVGCSKRMTLKDVLYFQEKLEEIEGYQW
jgi:predicted nucleotidyltransferase